MPYFFTPRWRLAEVHINKESSLIHEHTRYGGPNTIDSVCVDHRASSDSSDITTHNILNSVCARYHSRPPAHTPRPTHKVKCWVRALSLPPHTSKHACALYTPPRTTATHGMINSPPKKIGGISIRSRRCSVSKGVRGEWSYD